MNAKSLADLCCFLQSNNTAFAKLKLCTWAYKDGIVVNGIEDSHFKLFKKACEIREFSWCNCRQCWIAIVDGAKAISVRKILWQTSSMPEPSMVENGILPPDFPTIREHVAFINQLQQHNLLRCGKMIPEGQNRTELSIGNFL